MRLIDEIITQSAYMDFDTENPTEYVGVSLDCVSIMLEEVSKELDKEEVTVNDIENSLTLKLVIIPSLNSIDYRFLREIKIK